MARLDTRPRITSADIVDGTIQGVDLAQSLLLVDGQSINTGTLVGLTLGTATNELLAFHNATPAGQAASAAQAAVATTAATNVAPYGFSQSQADALVALVNALRVALVEKGLIKGSA